jgi:hypothetical protein
LSSRELTADATRHNRQKLAQTVGQWLASARPPRRAAQYVNRMANGCAFSIKDKENI